MFVQDETLERNDYYVPLHFAIGLQKLGGNNLSEISLAVSKNLYASNRAGIVNTNTLIVKLQHSYLF